MLKLIPTFPQSGTSWDHQGKSNISQIFISCSEYRIDSIQFAYVEDGAVVLSERIGRSEGCDTLKTITFGNGEHITSVRGCYQTYHGGKRYLSRVTFYTNRGKYGPYQPCKLGGDPGCDYGPSSSDEYQVSEKKFSYEVGGGFYGFFGTFWGDGIESLGVYMNPLQVSRPAPPIKVQPYC